jgi:hypothetical protein
MMKPLQESVLPSSPPRRCSQRVVDVSTMPRHSSRFAKKSAHRTPAVTATHNLLMKKLACPAVTATHNLLMKK